MSSAYKVLPLLTRFRVATSGATGVAGVYTRIELSAPGLTGALLPAASLELITLQIGAQAPNLEWNIEFVGGFDRDHEVSPPVTCGGDLSTNDVPTRSAPFTDVSKFFPHTRAVLRFKNKDGVSGVQTALISALVLIKLPE